MATLYQGYLQLFELLTVCMPYLFDLVSCILCICTDHALSWFCVFFIYMFLARVLCHLIIIHMGSFGYFMERVMHLLQIKSVNCMFYLL